MSLNRTVIEALPILKGVVLLPRDGEVAEGRASCAGATAWHQEREARLELPW